MEGYSHHIKGTLNHKPKPNRSAFPAPSRPIFAPTDRVSCLFPCAVAPPRHRPNSAANDLVARFENEGILREITGQVRNRRFRYQSYIDLFNDAGPQTTT